MNNSNLTSSTDKNIRNHLISLKKLYLKDFDSIEDLQKHIETKLEKVFLDETKTLLSQTNILFYLDIKKSSIANRIEKYDLNLSANSHKKMISSKSFIRYFAVPEIMGCITSKKAI